MLSFDLIQEYYDMVQVMADGTGKTRSDIIEDLAKTGALLIFVSDEYIRSRDQHGQVMCEMLKLYNVEVKTQHLNSQNYILYTHSPTDDPARFVLDKVYGPRTKMAITLDPGFWRYVVWLQKKHKWSVSYTMATLIKFGLALNHYADSEPSEQFPKENIDKCIEIKNHIVMYQHDTNLVEVKKISNRTRTNFQEIKNPAGFKRARQANKQKTTKHDNVIGAS